MTPEEADNFDLLQDLAHDHNAVVEMKYMVKREEGEKIGLWRIKFVNQSDLKVKFTQTGKHFFQTSEYLIDKIKEAMTDGISSTDHTGA